MMWELFHIDRVTMCLGMRLRMSLMVVVTKPYGIRSLSRAAFERLVIRLRPPHPPTPYLTAAPLTPNPPPPPPQPVNPNPRSPPPPPPPPQTPSKLLFCLSPTRPESPKFQGSEFRMWSSEVQNPQIP